VTKCWQSSAAKPEKCVGLVPTYYAAIHLAICNNLLWISSESPLYTATVQAVFVYARHATFSGNFLHPVSLIKRTRNWQTSYSCHTISGLSVPFCSSQVRSHRQKNGQTDRRMDRKDPYCSLLRKPQNNDNVRKKFPLHTILKQLALLFFISLHSLEIFSKHDSAASSLILLTRSVSSNTVLHTSVAFLLYNKTFI